MSKITPNTPIRITTTPRVSILLWSEFIEAMSTESLLDDAAGIQADLEARGVSYRGFLPRFELRIEERKTITVADSAAEEGRHRRPMNLRHSPLGSPCDVCGGKRYIISERIVNELTPTGSTILAPKYEPQEMRVIERCDACSYDNVDDEKNLTDLQAALLAQEDGIRCSMRYPHVIYDPRPRP